MGSRGPTTKGEGRQRRNAPAVVVELRPDGRPVDPTTPAPPPGLLAATRRQWEAFWRSEVRPIVIEADEPALRSLFEYIDERARCLRALRQARVVEGSTGQPVMNPLAGYVLQLDKAITALEDRFGLTPMARARLGLTVGHARLTAAQLNRMTDAPTPAGRPPASVDEAELLAEFTTENGDTDRMDPEPA